MDWNVAVLSGQLAVDPEIRELESGVRFVRYLVTVRVDVPRRRVDVVPVTLWDPPDETIGRNLAKGSQVWVVGSVQRRFLSDGDRRVSRLELVAHHVDRAPQEPSQAEEFGPAAN